MRQAGSPARCSGASDTTWGSCGMRGRRRARACDYFRRTGAMIFAYITVFPRTRSGFFVYASMEGPAHSYPFSETHELSSRYASRYSPEGPLKESAATSMAGISRIRTAPSGAAFLRPAVQPLHIRLEWDLVIAADVLDVRQFHRLASLDFDRRHPCTSGVRTT